MNLEEQKKKLIDSLIDSGVLKTKEIIEAFRKVRREDFVLPRYKDYSYADEPLPLIEGQTISQPYTVAAMTEALQPMQGQKILEVGAGSGYQAAILAEVVGKKGKIITVERLKPLVDFATKNLCKTGYSNVNLVEGDGSQGCKDQAPYNRIIVTASAPSIPEPLIKQLKVGGILVIPIGDEMFAIKKTSKNKIEETLLGYYAFVPLIGKHGHKLHME